MIFYMLSDYFPELMEIEYSFKEGGHNSLKFIDGRFFFFSEADSNLTEKNEYLTMVTLPGKSELKDFWNDLDHLGLWNWEEKSNIIESASSTEVIHPPGENNHHHHEGNCCEDEIPGKVPEGDIWQVKIVHGQKQIYIKSWFLEDVPWDEFFKVVHKLFKMNINLPYFVLKEKLRFE